MKKFGEAPREKNSEDNPINPVLWHAIPNSIVIDSAISTGAKVTYAMFLNYTWNNDSCFPGKSRLADDIGFSRTRVTRCIAELEKAGLITIQRRGQGKSNLYTIHRREPKATGRLA
jgi:hypothetical protein